MALYFDLEGFNPFPAFKTSYDAFYFPNVMFYNIPLECCHLCVFLSEENGSELVLLVLLNLSLKQFSVVTGTGGIIHCPGKGLKRVRSERKKYHEEKKLTSFAKSPMGTLRE